MGRKKKPPTKLINFRVPEDRAEECKAACREAIAGVVSANRVTVKREENRIVDPEWTSKLVNQPLSGNEGKDQVDLDLEDRMREIHGDHWFEPNENRSDSKNQS